MSMKIHKLASFKKEVSPLLVLVTNDIYLESIWLSVMAMLEDIAAKYILSNITNKTPNESLRNIIEHVQDEQRHAQMLNDMRPALLYPANFYYEVEQIWKEIADEFIMAFFNSPELREANHRHAAYVHGAQTIERFPFRIYTLYLSHTKLAKVHEKLPQVIADENGHIELGKKMYNELAADDRMSLSRLYKLEEDLCLMMLKRMKIALTEKLELSEKIECSLVLKLKSSRALEIALIHSLSKIEKQLSPKRSELLKSANTLLRAKQRSELSYRQLELIVAQLGENYFSGCLSAGISRPTILGRLNRFYTDVLFQTNSMALHYAFYRILEEHQTENESNEAEKLLENKYWKKFLNDLEQMDQYEDGISFSRA